MKAKYVDKKFRPESLNTITTVNSIIADYRRQGFVLTVRQLYYQLVARDYIANNLREYKRIAGLLNDARLAGLVDWDAIEDRTRDFIRRSRWTDGAHILENCAKQFHMDMWDNQDRRMFVIVEKEALVGVLERVCREFDVPLLAARGYPSVSVVRDFVMSDLAPTVDHGQSIKILHLGDHDPSGLDMTRDLTDRINLFLGAHTGEWVDIERVALNMDQIEELQPPENPAKTTDSRFDKYMEKYGDSSWELDALPPSYLAQLVRSAAEDIIDPDAWEQKESEINDIKARISEVAKSFGGD